MHARLGPPLEIASAQLCLLLQQPLQASVLLLNQLLQAHQLLAILTPLSRIALQTQQTLLALIDKITAEAACQPQGDPAIQTLASQSDLLLKLRIRNGSGQHQTLGQ